MNYDEMLEKLPKDLVTFVREAVSIEAESLTLVQLRPGGRRASKGEVEGKLEEAKGYLVSDVEKFLGGQMHFNPRSALTLRPRYTAAWAVAQLLAPPEDKLTKLVGQIVDHALDIHFDEGCDSASQENLSFANVSFPRDAGPGEVAVLVVSRMDHNPDDRETQTPDRTFIVSVKEYKP